MQSYNFAVLVPGPNDLPKLARVHYEACASDPGFSSIFPVPPSSGALTHLEGEFKMSMRDDPGFHILMVKEIISNGIASCAIWQFIPPRSMEQVEDNMLSDVDAAAFPEDANIELGRKLVKSSIRKRIEIVSTCFGMGAPYIYLVAIGTDPRYQRRGAASMLVAWAVERADAQSLPMYVESTPQATNLYAKFGFLVFDLLNLDLRPHREGDFSNVCMIRPRRVASQ